MSGGSKDEKLFLVFFCEGGETKQILMHDPI